MLLRICYTSWIRGFICVFHHFWNLLSIISSLLSLYAHFRTPIRYRRTSRSFFDVELFHFTHIFIFLCRILNKFSFDVSHLLFHPLNVIFISVVIFSFSESPLLVIQICLSFLLVFCHKLIFVIATLFGMRWEAGSKKNS